MTKRNIIVANTPTEEIKAVFGKIKEFLTPEMVMDYAKVANSSLQIGIDVAESMINDGEMQRIINATAEQSADVLESYEKAITAMVETGEKVETLIQSIGGELNRYKMSFAVKHPIKSAKLIASFADLKSAAGRIKTKFEEVSNTIICGQEYADHLREQEEKEAKRSQQLAELKDLAEHYKAKRLSEEEEQKDIDNVILPSVFGNDQTIGEIIKNRPAGTSAMDALREAIKNNTNGEQK